MRVTVEMNGCLLISSSNSQFHIHFCVNEIIVRMIHVVFSNQRSNQRATQLEPARRPPLLDAKSNARRGRTRSGSEGERASFNLPGWLAYGNSNITRIYPLHSLRRPQLYRRNVRPPRCFHRRQARRRCAPGRSRSQLCEQLEEM